MRRFLFGVSAIAILGTACQTPQPVRAPGPPRPGSRSTGPTQPPGAAIPRPARPDVPRALGDPSWFPRCGKISPRWTTVVIHHSATATGSARSFDKSHRDKGWDELGYHFVIGNGTGSGDGVIEVGSRWHSQKHGAHCKTPDNYFNEHGIGVCLVGDFTRTRPTPRQMESLRRLTAFLSDQCGISVGRVTTHGAFTRKT
ncbi:MAG: N-acetylmuramoyl-L-alanine amidase [Phycisphaerales bacterium]|nr:N-acetylmuramoyl-L-alanine amidase [Phycisphaerales bacterium]